MTQESARRRFGVTVLLGLGASVLTAVAVGRQWASVHLGGSSGGEAYASILRLRTDVSGADAEPLAAAAAWVAVVAWGVLLVTRGRTRTAAAVVGAVTATLALALAARGFWTAQDLAVSRATRLPGGSDVLEVSLAAWYPAALVAGVASLAALVVAVRDAPAWPAMGARYDAPAAASEPAPAPADRSEELWRALDDGRDPTAEREP